MTLISRVRIYNPGDLARAEDVNASINNIHSVINGDLDDSNIEDNSLDLDAIGVENSVTQRLLRDNVVDASKINIDDDLDLKDNQITNLQGGTAPSDAATVSQLENNSRVIANMRVFHPDIEIASGGYINTTINRNNISRISDDAKAAQISWNWSNDDTNSALVQVKQGTSNTWTDLSNPNDTQDVYSDGPDGTVSVFWTFDSDGKIDVLLDGNVDGKVKVISEI